MLSLHPFKTLFFCFIVVILCKYHKLNSTRHYIFTLCFAVISFSLSIFIVQFTLRNFSFFCTNNHDTVVWTVESNNFVQFFLLNNSLSVHLSLNVYFVRKCKRTPVFSCFCFVSESINHSNIGSNFPAKVSFSTPLTGKFESKKQNDEKGNVSFHHIYSKTYSKLACKRKQKHNNTYSV